MNKGRTRGYGGGRSRFEPLANHKSHPHRFSCGRIDADGSGWGFSCSGGETLGNSRFRNTPNESAIAFDKGELVSQASFKQDGYAMVTC